MFTQARYPLGVVTALLLLLVPGGESARAQKRPPLFHDFLAQYTGKEILLINISSDSLQFVQSDSAEKYVVVLDEVRDDMLIVHRSTSGDKRSFSYPLADIRRVTYLFGGRPYRRIVVETF